MKNLYFFTVFCILTLPIVSAQVGIGTVNPQEDLHVAGELLIQSELITAGFSMVTNADEDFELITRVTNSNPTGELKVLNTDALTVAPVNVFEYEFTNVYLDNVTNVDLQYDVSKYIVSIANFRCEGDAIKKVYNGSAAELGYFVQRTFEENGTWHLEIRNRTLDLDIGDELTYKLTLIVYDRAYFKKLPINTTNLNNLNTGIATIAPVLN